MKAVQSEKVPPSPNVLLRESLDFKQLTRLAAVAPTGLPGSTIRPVGTNSGRDGDLFLGSAALGATVSVVLIQRGVGPGPRPPGQQNSHF